MDVAPPAATAAALAEVIAAHRYRFVTEYDLQAAVGAVVRDAGYQVSPEHVLSMRDRVDFLVAGRVVVEVKIGGSYGSVLHQINRYAVHDQVTEILLVTTCRRHRSQMVSTSRKPVHVLLVTTA